MKKRRKLITIILVSVIIIFLSLIIWIIWGPKDYDPFSAYSYQTVPTDVYEINALEGNVEIELPDSAREIYTYTTGFQDIFIMIRFEIYAYELSDFLDSTLCVQPLNSTSPGLQVLLASNPSWWEPHKSKHLEECYGKDTHSHQHVLVDMTDSEIYIVYVSNSVY